MTTTWTRAALAYEAHRAELETARKQYEHAVADTMGRFRDAVSARLGGELVHHSDTDVDDPGPGRSWISFSLSSEDLEVAVVHAWSSAAYGGPPGTLAVGVEGKPCGAPLLGWGIDPLRVAARERLRWLAPDLASAENGDLHNAGIAAGALCLFRSSVQDGDAVTAATAKFIELTEQSGGLVAAIRERAPQAWATYGGILDAARELAVSGVRLTSRGKPREWMGMTYVTLESARRKACVSTRPTGQLVFSADSDDWAIDDAFARTFGIAPETIDGCSSLSFPEGVCKEGRHRVKQLVVEAARAHLLAG